MADFENNKPNLERYSFPHIADTQFPMLENVNVYEYENNFDYNRWTDDTKIYLCNVLWNSDYSNVVKFENDSKRDEYFNNLNRYTVDLTTAFHVAPDNSVKVPVPYQVATRYNYMYIDLPIMTSENEPINYESPRRTQRFYYFINDVMQNSPNSTALMVSLDSWTTYINNINIPYMMLERGHAPMAATDVDEYLANPIENNQYLLAPDYDFSNDADIVASSDFIPVNNGEKYIMIATSMNYAQVSGLAYPSAWDGVTTAATFEDTSTRYGYQYKVNDYNWCLGDYDYDGIYTNTKTYQSTGNSIPNNVFVFAVKATDASSAFNTMSNVVPYFAKTIQACFMVDETMFTKGREFAFCNKTCYEALPVADSLLATINLTKDMFGYNEHYSNIAKLYTSPYAHFEVTDNNGNTKKFNVENISTLQARKACSIAFPYISMQAYLTGVNGSGSETYRWKQLDGNEKMRRMYADDFGEYLFDWDIPTYALFVRGYDNFKASYSPQLEIERYSALVEYHNSVDGANTQNKNANDSANTTKSMTDASATTEYGNAVAMNNTIETNTKASATTAKNNVYAEADTMRDNTDLSNKLRTYMYGAQNDEIDDGVQWGNVKIEADRISDNKYSKATTQAETDYAAMAGWSNAVGALGSAVSGGMGSVGFGNPLGGIGAGIEFVGSAVQTGMSTAATITKEQSILDATLTANGEKCSHAKQYNTTTAALVTLQNTERATRTNSTNETITDNSATTMENNATRTMNTAHANAERARSTGNSNAKNTRDTTKSNAESNRNTAVANSDYTDHSNIRIAQRNLELRRQKAIQQYHSNRLEAPVQFGVTTGDAELDAYERRGLQIKLRTQPKGMIAQAGDLMLRYGYALNQAWEFDNESYVPMEYFCYWKCSDIWINEGEGVNQLSLRDIKNAFMNGVTVWKNPDVIGKVSIYDNRAYK